MRICRRAGHQLNQLDSGVLGRCGKSDVSAPFKELLDLRPPFPRRTLKLRKYVVSPACRRPTKQHARDRNHYAAADFRGQARTNGPRKRGHTAAGVMMFISHRKTSARGVKAWLGVGQQVILLLVARAGRGLMRGCRSTAVWRSSSQATWGLTSNLPLLGTRPRTAHASQWSQCRFSARQTPRGEAACYFWSDSSSKSGL